MAGFKYKYSPLSYNTATKWAKNQLDPLYQNAVRNVQAQKYNNEMQAGTVAQARGLSHSGLAADQLTKIGIAAQSQIKDLNAQRNAQMAQMAQNLVQRNQDVNDRRRSQLFNEYMSQQQFNYQKSRANVADSQWNKQFNASRSDAKWQKEWQKYMYNHMSATEKAQLDWMKKQYGEYAAWRMYELNQTLKAQKEMYQTQIDGYSGFSSSSGGGWIPNARDGKYKISSGFGYRGRNGGENHGAVDIAVPRGTKLASTVSGTVVYSGWGKKGSGYGNYGNVVAIRTANGDIHLFAHMDGVGVKVGQRVNRGQFIGISGNTGDSDGPHLHYEVRRGGNINRRIDPTPWLR
ncbi:M23 family metallopeptidase [Fictibacillus gelatini]|uniref:M23 family metallopeptidase n=1 Tax=Fictibacillus gelatini TaxID=225985 RepID=UPI000413FA1D|nr:M23 family metallopeptidase [Fictibacillus gelatini]